MTVLPQEKLTEEAVEKILRDRIEWKKLPGLVVGIVDESGARMISVGRFSRESERPIDGDTVFEIGSATKVFTALLLAEMFERGELALDDPVAKFLPKSVKIPTRGGKQITLRHLAQHTAGLPRMPDNFAPKDANNPYADYSVQQLYDFLSKHKLNRDVGDKADYSNIGMGLLGHALALRGGADYETLVVKRICEPLGMSDTRITLTAEMKARLAQGHSRDGKATKHWDIPTLAGAGALRSTANDLLKFLSAYIGLRESSIAPAMRLSLVSRHPTNMPNLEVALGWHVTKKFDAEFFWHNGQTGGYHSFIGFNQQQRRGVVVLCNAGADIDDIGYHLLDSRFELSRKRTAIAIDPAILDAYVGQYQLTSDSILTVRKANDRLTIQTTGQGITDAFPETETKFFFDDVDAQITFVKDKTGKVTHLILHPNALDLPAKKISNVVPKGHEVVKVDPNIYDAYVGQYEFTPTFVLTVTREGDKLLAQATGQPQFEIFPESETKFFYKAVDAQIIFVKDKTGKVTHLILHQGGDTQAKKMK